MLYPVMNRLYPGLRVGRKPISQLARRHKAPSYARYFSFKIEDLQKKFRDPNSPYHIAPGTQGPDSPDPVNDSLSSKEEAYTKLAGLGYDPESFWEQQVCWGDHDSFQHVNNVQYARFFESSRIHWMYKFGQELGGTVKAEQMCRGKGVSLILKSLSLNYKSPVTFPDTLLVAHKPYPGPSSRNTGASALPRTHFNMAGAIWSYAQRKIVTECDSVLVWYDYDQLKKCEPEQDVKAVLLRRMSLRSEEGML